MPGQSHQLLNKRSPVAAVQQAPILSQMFHSFSTATNFSSAGEGSPRTSPHEIQTVQTADQFSQQRYSRADVSSTPAPSIPRCEEQKTLFYRLHSATIA